MGQEILMHTFNCNTREGEADKSQNLMLTWFIQSISGQPGLHNETLSQNNNNISY